MDNFKLIYKILRHLEASLDCEVLDVEAISHNHLGVSYERREQLLIMMQDAGCRVHQRACARQGAFRQS